MINPLLAQVQLPLFSQVKPEHIEPAINTLLSEARAVVDERLKTNDYFTFENLIDPIEDAEDKLNKAWSVVSHLNSVVNSDELREAYNACLPKLSDYGTEMGQNEVLFKAYRQLADSPEFSGLTVAQQKIIENTLQNFTLSGIALEEEKKQRFKKIRQELSLLPSKYEENLLNASNAWYKHISDKSELAGLPDSALALAEEAAQNQGKDGWVLSLQYPSYLAVMTYADNRALRQEVYRAFVTRASDLGDKPEWDNSQIMKQILALRHEQAQLLGFANYAELSLATKMADTPEDVVKLLDDLASKSWSRARRDLHELREFSKQNFGLYDLQSWDVSYFSEKMRQHHYQLSQEEVKAYFPVTQVLNGLFSLISRLYEIEIKELSDFDTYHNDVRFFEIHETCGELRGHFYLDLYARNKKNNGAWMDVAITRCNTKTSVQTPVVYLVCDFTPASQNRPALLTHSEVVTLFHEFGHGLHHLLTKVDHLGVSGIHGVEWDAVELPSQFMENWCWQKDVVIPLLSGHYQTGEKLPESLFDKMYEAKNYQTGMRMVRQLEFALFDFLIHKDYDAHQISPIDAVLEDVRKQVAVMAPPKFNRFAHSFSHIFSGGYAAGYYSYLWAEVLSADAFAMFEEQGIFNPEVARAFLTNILEKGGSQSAMELFTAFRGRPPEIDAFLRHSGIV